MVIGGTDAVAGAEKVTIGAFEVKDQLSDNRATVAGSKLWVAANPQYNPADSTATAFSAFMMNGSNLASGTQFSGTYAVSFDGHLKDINISGKTKLGDTVIVQIGSPDANPTVDGCKLDADKAIGFELNVPRAISSGNTIITYITAAAVRDSETLVNMEFLK